MKWRAIVAIVLVAIGLFGVPKMPSGSQQLVQTKEPSKEMKASVAAVARVAKDMSIVDRLWLQYIYMNCGKVVLADGLVDQPTIVTTEGLRAVHRAVLKFIWKGMAGNTPNKYVGLAQAIDDAVVSVIGDEQKPLTEALRGEAIEVFDAIAWAGLGKDE
jgi:hypothetical protein